MFYRTQFSLFHSHLDLAQDYWRKLIQPGDCVIDATSGNGHDTLFLAQLLLSDERPGSLIAIDKQSQAVEATFQRLSSHLSPKALAHIRFLNQCHTTFPNDLAPTSVALIVYNLGYLPGGKKTLTTVGQTTLQSLEAALPLIKPGGCISLTCYPGHPEGKIEEDLVLQFSASLNPRSWNCCFHRWTNRYESPGLLLMQRCI